MAKDKKEKDSVAEAILSLAEAVSSLEKNLREKIDALKKEEVVVSPINNTATPEPEPLYPFPKEWRDLIDDTLNPAFKADVNYRPDAHFELSIWVPKEYSNAKPGHWDLVHEDKRFQVISNAMGLTGVREFVEKVAQNLGVDIMKKVGEDRLNLIRG